MSKPLIVFSMTNAELQTAIDHTTDAIFREAPVTPLARIWQAHLETLLALQIVRANQMLIDGEVKS